MPIPKHTPSRRGRLLSLVRPEPMCSPIGVIARSAPRLKSAMPNIRNTAEIRKTEISAALKWISGVRFKKNTIATIGRTETSDSLSFLSKTEFIFRHTS